MLKFKGIISIITLVALINFSACGSVKNKNGAPKGYRNITFIKIAVGLKILDLVDLKPEVPSGLIEYRDLVYENIGGEGLKLDIYRPKAMAKPTPALIFIHGGSWKSGHKEDYKVYTLDFAKRGYVTVSLSYRLLPKYHYPDCVEDVKCALGWIRAHASDYNIDPENIALIGASAGGHLATLVGYSSDSPVFESKYDEDSISSRVQAVVDFYGPVDFTASFSKEAEGLLNNFMNQTYQENPSLYEQASPLKYVSKDDPPTLIFHGTIDDLVPVGQSDLLKAELDKQGVANEYYRLEGWPHGMDLALSVNEYCKNKLAIFLHKYVPLPE